MGEIIGALIDGRYRVESELGSGGMATVYLAEQESLKRKVVVKIPDAGLLRNEEFRVRFEREVRSLVQLGHPNNVTVLDAGEFDGTPYFVMEHLEGGSLKERLEARRAEGGRESPAEALEWLAPVASALDFVHAQDVVHRDVKPANVLFDRSGHAFLSDFGIAKALGPIDTDLTNTGSTPGTPIYMAPEAGTSDGLVAASDQYSLAVVLFEALSGRIPFEGDTPVVMMVKKLTEEPGEISDHVPDLPRAAAAVVMRALSRDPAARFPSCREFVDAFRRAVEDGAAEADDGTGTYLVAEPVAPAAPAGRGRGRIPGLVALLLLLAGGAVAAWLLLRDDEPAGPPARARLILTDAPEEDSYVRTGELEIAGRVEGLEGGYLELNGERTELGPSGSFRIRVALEEGVNELALHCVRGDGRVARARELRVYRDTAPPDLRMRAPDDGALTRSEEIPVEGTLTDPNAEEVRLGGAVLPVGSDGRFEGAVRLAEGENRLRFVGRDRAGNEAEAVVTVVRDSTPPTVECSLPPEKRVTRDPTIVLPLLVADAHPSHLLVDGRRIDLARPEVNLPVELPEGIRHVSVVAVDRAGNRSPPLDLEVRRDETPPVVTIHAPPSYTSSAAVEVAGAVSEDGCAVRVAGVAAAVEGRSFRAEVPLEEGPNELPVVAEDAAGNSGEPRTVRVVRDSTPPGIELGALPETVAGPRVLVRGTLTEEGCEVTVNGAAAAVDGRGFRRTVDLESGENEVRVVARDRAGNAARASASVRRVAPRPGWIVNRPTRAHAYADATLRRFEALVREDGWEVAPRPWNDKGMLEAVHRESGLVFVLVPAGSYRRGSPKTEEGSEEDERPQAEVTVPAFLLSKTECTQRAWDAVGGEDDRAFPGEPEYPIERVSWEDADAWCRKAGDLRLPTEAEWEYACRAGSEARWCYGDDEGRLKNFAWYDENSHDEETGEQRPHAVATRRHPNSWGLWDMHGNVWEWVRDTRNRTYEGVPTDGSAWIEEGEEDSRTRRGGGWSSNARACRSADRRGGGADLRDDSTGFRPARSLP